MATMDRDTFIPLGTSIVKLLLIASGQGALHSGWRRCRTVGEVPENAGNRRKSGGLC